jgi:hypothetical protein
MTPISTNPISTPVPMVCLIELVMTDTSVKSERISRSRYRDAKPLFQATSTAQPSWVPLLAILLEAMPSRASHVPSRDVLRSYPQNVQFATSGLTVVTSITVTASSNRTTSSARSAASKASLIKRIFFFTTLSRSAPTSSCRALPVQYRLSSTRMFVASSSPSFCRPHAW